MNTYEPAPDYQLSSVLELHGSAITMDDRIACRRCPNADWIVELTVSEYGEDASPRSFCAAFGRQVYPGFKIRDCDARRKAIRAERAADDL
jgi:hypothetical protein